MSTRDGGKKLSPGYEFPGSHLSVSFRGTEDQLRDAEDIRRTSESWSQVEWDEGEPEGDPRISLGVPELVSGTPDGLIPIASTDRAEVIFYAPRGASGRGSLFIENGDYEFLDYSFSFAEWLYRWLVG
ncbi:hypothetical protein [Streptomyces sp. NPDC050538]